VVNATDPYSCNPGFLDRSSIGYLAKTATLHFLRQSTYPLNSSRHLPIEPNLVSGVLFALSVLCGCLECIMFLCGFMFFSM
jgi:hypothetical protein